jgi:hypothetical protein
MKRALIAGTFLILGSLAFLGQTPIPREELANVFPASARVEQFTLTGDGQRTYYTTTSGDVWLYARDNQSNTRIIAGNVWDVSVSQFRDALAYTKGAETRLEQHVWMLPLDPETGLAAGSERLLSARSGDVPSISPDGKWIAFARDDSNGVGQSVVAVSTSGGSERVVASALPSSVGNIRWTPDGKVLYFGVYPPVPFTCAESCLSVPGGNREVPGTIRRVAFAGGLVEVVATTGNPSPGLAPDGLKLVFADPGKPRQFVVADTNGQQSDTFNLQATQTLQGWSGKSTLLLTTKSGTAAAPSVSEMNLFPKK